MANPIREHLHQRFWVRTHMALILLACLLAGLFTTRLLLAFGVHSMAWRYALATVAGYAAFFGALRVWLWYVGVLTDEQAALDRQQFTQESLSESADVVVEPVFRNTPSLGDVGEAISGAADGEGCLLLAVGVACAVGLVLLSGGAIWLIYEAPWILAEVALQAMMAAGLLRASRHIDQPGWVGSVWRTTCWPFLLTLMLMISLGWVLQMRHPTATTLVEVLAASKAQSAQ